MNQETSSSTRIPASSRAARPVPVDESGSDIDSIIERIESGQAFLRVVEYPWGVEFDVCDSGETR